MSEATNPYQAPKSDTRLFNAQNFSELNDKELKKLRNHSNSIRALTLVWFLCGLIAAIGLVVSFRGILEGEIQLRFGFIFSVLFVALLLLSITIFWRSNYSRWIGVVLCIVSLLFIPIGTILGALGLAAFIGGGKLFGDNKYDSSELEKEFRYRRKNKILY